MALSESSRGRRQHCRRCKKSAETVLVSPSPSRRPQAAKAKAAVEAARADLERYKDERALGAAGGGANIEGYKLSAKAKADGNAKDDDDAANDDELSKMEPVSTREDAMARVQFEVQPQMTVTEIIKESQRMLDEEDGKEPERPETSETEEKIAARVAELEAEKASKDDAVEAQKKKMDDYLHDEQIEGAGQDNETAIHVLGNVGILLLDTRWSQVACVTGEQDAEAPLVSPESWDQLEHLLLYGHEARDVSALVVAVDEPPLDPFFRPERSFTLRPSRRRRSHATAASMSRAGLVSAELVRSELVRSARSVATRARPRARTIHVLAAAESNPSPHTIEPACSRRPVPSTYVR